MNADDFRIELERLGLGQNAFARLFDYDSRRVRRWATGKESVPRVVEVVFGLMERGDVPELARVYGVNLD
jgi:hypothetical protein